MNKTIKTKGSAPVTEVEVDCKTIAAEIEYNMSGSRNPDPRIVEWVEKTDLSNLFFVKYHSGTRLGFDFDAEKIIDMFERGCR